MKKIFNISFLSLGILFFILKNSLHYSPAYINIANDIVALPCFLIVLNFVMHFLYGNRFEMKFLLILTTFAAISILSEGIFPMIYKTSTGDVLDVLWYANGTVLFSLVNAKKPMAGHIR